MQEERGNQGQPNDCQHKCYEQCRESVAINASLMNLGRCLEALRWNQQHRAAEPRLVPYRESKVSRPYQHCPKPASTGCTPCMHASGSRATVLRRQFSCCVCAPVQRCAAWVGPPPTVCQCEPLCFAGDPPVQRCAARVGPDSAVRQCEPLCQGS